MLTDMWLLARIEKLCEKAIEEPFPSYDLCDDDAEYHDEVQEQHGRKNFAKKILDLLNEEKGEA